MHLTGLKSPSWLATVFSLSLRLLPVPPRIAAAGLILAAAPAAAVPIGVEPAEYDSTFGVDESAQATGTGVPPQGNPKVQVDPADPDTLYAGTVGSGFWKSTDRGRTWVPKSKGLRSFAVDVIRVSPVDGTLYLAESRFYGAANGNVMRSTDQGETWEPLARCRSTFAPSTYFYSMDAARDGGGAENLWIAMGHSNSQCGMGFRSTDGGDTWCAYNGPTNPNCHSDWSMPIADLDCGEAGAVHGDDGFFVLGVEGTDEVYLANSKQYINPRDYEAPFCNGIYRSEDPSSPTDAWQIADRWTSSSRIQDSEQCEYACQDMLRATAVVIDPDDAETRFGCHVLRDAADKLRDLNLAYHDGERNLRGERVWRDALDLYDECSLAPMEEGLKLRWDVVELRISPPAGPQKWLYSTVQFGVPLPPNPNPQSETKGDFLIGCDASAASADCSVPGNWSCLRNFTDEAIDCGPVQCAPGSEDWTKAQGVRWKGMEVMRYPGANAHDELLLLGARRNARQDVMRVSHDGTDWTDEVLQDPILCKPSGMELLTPLQMIEVSPGRLAMSSPRELAIRPAPGLAWQPQFGYRFFSPLLAQSPSNPAIVYILEQGGIRRSTDGLATIRVVESVEGRADPPQYHGCSGCTFLGGNVCPPECRDPQCSPDAGCDAAEFALCPRFSTLPMGCEKPERCGRVNRICGDITDLAVDSMDDETLYAATSSGLWRWKHPYTGVDPCYPAIPIDEVTYFGAIYAGETWERMGPACPPGPGEGECVEDVYFSRIASHPTDPMLLLAGSPDGLYRSTNAGEYWFKVLEPGDAINRILLKPPLVFLGTDAGLYRSANDGLDFTLTDLVLPVRDVATLDGVTVYAAVMDWDETTFVEGVYKSTDGGFSWDKVVASQENQKAMSVFVEGNGTVHVGLLGAGVFELEPAAATDCDYLASKSKGAVPGDILLGSALTSVGDFVDTFVTQLDCGAEFAALEFQAAPLQARVRVFDKNMLTDRGAAPLNPGVNLSFGWGSLQGVGDLVLDSAPPLAEDCPDIAIGIPFPTVNPGLVRIMDVCRGDIIATLQETTPQFGMSQARSGNFLAVGAPGGFQPRVFVYDLQSLPVAIRTIDSPAQSNDFGWSLAFGDMNADGFADLAVGAPEITVFGSGGTTLVGPGKVYIYSGHDNWTTLLRTLSPPGSGAIGFGYALSSGYDRLSPSGAADLVVGAPGHQAKGGAFWYGSSSDLTADVLVGEAALNEFGAAVLLTRDATGDLLPDLVVGAPKYVSDPISGLRPGAVYFYESPGVLACDRLVGTVDRGDFGWRITEAGDVDTTRTVDLLIGQPDTDLPNAIPDPGPGTLFLRQVRR